MGATSRRCSSGATRAKGPKARVWSLRVGPCQASAIEPPRETGWQGCKAAGSQWHRNDSQQVKRQAHAGKTEEDDTTAETRRRIVGQRRATYCPTRKRATIGHKGAEN